MKSMVQVLDAMIHVVDQTIMDFLAEFIFFTCFFSTIFIVVILQF